MRSLHIESEKEYKTKFSIVDTAFEMNWFLLCHCISHGISYVIVIRKCRTKKVTPYQYNAMCFRHTVTSIPYLQSAFAIFTTTQKNLLCSVFLYFLGACITCFSSIWLCFFIFRIFLMFEILKFVCNSNIISRELQFFLGRLILCNRLWVSPFNVFFLEV